jgi:peroxiredoxin
MPRMKLTAQLVVCGLLVALFAQTAPAAEAADLAGAPAPDFVLKSLSGENLRLSEYRGEIVMLSFWASWCGDCRAQLRGLADVHDRYRTAGVELLTVSLDGARRQAEDTAAALDVRYPVLLDSDGTVGAQYAVESMPTLVLIDRDGIVRDVFTGYRHGAEEQYLERVRDLLRE